PVRTPVHATRPVRVSFAPRTPLSPPAPLPCCPLYRAYYCVFVSVGGGGGGGSGNGGGGGGGKRGKSGGGGSGGGKLAKEAVGMKSARDSSRGSGGRRRECWVCGDPDHLYYECPDLEDSENNDKRGGRRRFVGGRPRQDNKPRKEKQLTKQSSLVKDADSSSGGKARCDGEALCSMVDIVEPTVLLASEAGEEFKAVAAAVLANPSVWLTWLAS
ncbi:unnamed protein product, partial [Closterium sp. NIES-54]